jgi:hypothetical protein
MTPPAAQRATFEEDRGADARTIVNGELLDVENDTCRQVGSSSGGFEGAHGNEPPDEPIWRLSLKAQRLCHRG